MKKSYWFYIEPYVHVAANGSAALVYNCLNGKLTEYDHPVIVNLIKKLKSKKNLLVVRLTADRLADPGISAFVKEMKTFYSGDLIDTSYSKGKPLQMMPQVKIQKDAAKSRKVGEKTIGEGIMEYLKEITLYINNSCQQNCYFCREAYKQFLVCTNTSGRDKQELELEKVQQFLKEAEGSSLSRINISGGNIFTYSKFAELVRVLNNMPRVKTYQVYYLNLPPRVTELKALKNDLSYVNIFVDFPVKEQGLEKLVGICAEPGLNCEFNFIVQKLEDIGAAQRISSRLKINDAGFKPFYNQENYDFFKDNVFVNKEELLQAKPGLKDIYSRTKVNPLHFGRLTVLSNRAIHANVNRRKIGELGRDSLYDVVFREMYKGNSWINPRVEVSPCKSCNYSLLCSPISNYEYALKRNNLCNIWVDINN
jgi:pseudo-rSAM protein